MTDVTLPTPTPGAPGEHAFHTAVKTVIDELGANGAKVARTDVANTFDAANTQTVGIVRTKSRPIDITHPDYGAVSGGNATAALQAAVAAGADEVYVPPGTWNIAATLAPTNNLIIRGVPDASVIQASSGFGFPAGGTMVDFSNGGVGRQGVVIEDLTFNCANTANIGVKGGSPSTGGEQTPNYIRFDRFKNVLRSGIVVAATGGFGTHVLYNRIQISSSGQTADSRAIEMLGADNIVVGNRIAGGPLEACLFIGGGGQQVSLNHFVCDDQATATPVGIKLVTGGTQMFTNNYLDWMRDGPHVLVQPTVGAQIRGVQVSNNSIFGEHSTDNTNAFLKLDDSAASSVIEGVTVMGNTGRANSSARRFSYLIERTTTTLGVVSMGNVLQNVVALYNNAPLVSSGNAFHNGTSWASG